jgi:Flp pilus assembly protein TadD
MSHLAAARSSKEPADYVAIVRDAAADRPKDADIMLELVLALTEASAVDEAADVAQELAAATDKPDVLVQVAWALFTAGRAAAADAAAKRVLDSGPLPSVIENEATFLRGAALGALGREHLAERYLRDALARNRQRPEFIHGLAAFLVSHNRGQEALGLVNVAEGIADSTDRAETLEDLRALGLG